MKITGTIVKLGVLSLVLLVFTVLIFVVFGQLRFDRTTGYSAIFSNASGLRSGQFVRASGVEVGKVGNVEIIDGGTRVRVNFNVERDLQLFQRTITSIRYLNLIGDRYLELNFGRESLAQEEKADQRVGDQLVRLAFRDQRQDVALTAGQLAPRHAPRSLRRRGGQCLGQRQRPVEREADRLEGGGQILGLRVPDVVGNLARPRLTGEISHGWRR